MGPPTEVSIAVCGHTTRHNAGFVTADSHAVVAGERILIAEDEALVAMAMSDLMAELGFAVVGPFGKVSEAITVLRSGGVDAAILDVNLGGELVYPLADFLVTKGVPFVFVTGYGSESIDRRFANVRVLQKPIERQALENLFVHLGDARANSDSSIALAADNNRALAR